ncbi:MAG: hypothetical protein O2800_05490 [Planctomycetota bacterium]|nr:hypothetical protein [Planctomycetota bacterium]
MNEVPEVGFEFTGDVVLFIASVLLTIGVIAVGITIFVRAQREENRRNQGKP